LTAVTTPIIGAVVAAAVRVCIALRRWPKTRRETTVATPVVGAVIAATLVVGRALRGRTEADLQATDAAALNANHSLVATELGASVTTVEEAKRSAWSIARGAETTAVDNAIARIRVAALPFGTGFRNAAKLGIANLAGQAERDRINFAFMRLHVA
jgi:hypothetical protein